MDKTTDTRKRWVGNTVYALRLAWGLSPRRVVHGAALSLIGFFEWLFFSAFFMRILVDDIQAGKEFGTLAAFILGCGALFLGLALYAAWIRGAVFPLTANQVERGLNARLFKKARNVELGCFEDPAFYDTYTMAVDGAPAKVLNLAENAFGIFFGLIAFVVSFWAMFVIDPWAFLFIIFPLLGNFAFGGVMSRISMARYREGVPHDRKGAYVNRVMHFAQYAKEIRLSKVFNLLMGKLDESVAGNVGVAQKHAPKAVLFGWLQNFFTFAIVYEGVMIYAAWRMMVGHSISLGQMAVLFGIMVTSSWILIGLFNDMLSAMKNGMFMENLRAFLEYRETIPEDQDGLDVPRTVESIEFRQVSFRYGQGDMLLKDLNFRLEGGTAAALVGHNGAGKSTLLKLLFRLYDPTEGQILLNGIDIRRYRLRQYRNLFAAAFQDCRILSATIRDNVLMGRTVVDPRGVVEAALGKAGMWTTVQALPKGMDTVLTKEFDPEGAVLSGGQVQKIVVARAFAQDAPVKVFDEPSSALDPLAEQELYQSIMEESRGKTLLFISHRLSSVRDAGVVFLLQDGRLAEQGSHQELMAAGGAYADMYAKQARNYLLPEDGQIMEGVNA